MTARGPHQPGHAPVRASAFAGCLLGEALGDAMGLPYEGLSRRRVEKWFREPPRFRFIFGRGMVSDDTEHACMVAQSLLEAGLDAEDFARRLGWRLRWWLAALPAGTGLATARAIVKLWLGASPAKSGVFSAGNGPAMRSAIIGVAAGHDRSKMRDLVRVSTRITHTDPKAEQGALVVATAAWLAASTHGEVSPDMLRRALRSPLAADLDPELSMLIGRAADSVQRGDRTERFADELGWGRGVTGYMYATVPIVLHAWLSHPTDLEAAVTAVVRCGGDTDSTGAVTGALVGAGVGTAELPQSWLAGLVEWPRTVGWMRSLGENLAESVVTGPKGAPRLPAIANLLRNLVFLAIVFGHGLRRLLPPY